MHGERKKLLVIKASPDICVTEIEHICSVAAMLGMEHKIIDVQDAQSLFPFFKDIGKFDYIYLCAHASRSGFGAQTGFFVEWGHFSRALCEGDCLNEDSVLFLACCRGGLRGVAQILFSECGNIDYVCGPRWSVNAHDLTVGFHTFVYNVERRKEQPSIASKRASLGTGYEFFCYDRVEIEDEAWKFGTSTGSGPHYPDSSSLDPFALRQ